MKPGTVSYQAARRAARVGVFGPFLATLSLMAAQHVLARLGLFSSSPLKHHKSAAPALCSAELWRFAEKPEGLLFVLRGCPIEARRFDWKKFRVDEEWSEVALKLLTFCLPRPRLLGLQALLGLC